MIDLTLLEVSHLRQSGLKTRKYTEDRWDISLPRSVNSDLPGTIYWSDLHKRRHHLILMVVDDVYIIVFSLEYLATRMT